MIKHHTFADKLLDELNRRYDWGPPDHGDILDRDEMRASVEAVLKDNHNNGPSTTEEGKTPIGWVEAAYTRFLKINDGSKEKALTDLGTWIIGMNAVLEYFSLDIK